MLLCIKYLRVMNRGKNHITFYYRNDITRENITNEYRFWKIIVVYIIFDKVKLIMPSKITPKVVVAFTKMTIALSFSWPLSKSASKFQVIRFKILRFLLCLNATILIVPVVHTLYHNDYDVPKIMKLWCLLGAFIQIPLEITQCALQHDRLQVRNVYLQRYQIDFW